MKSSSPTATDEVPAFDLDSRTVFPEAGYPSGWGGTITLMHVAPIQMRATPSNRAYATGKFFIRLEVVVTPQAISLSSSNRLQRTKSKTDRSSNFEM